MKKGKCLKKAFGIAKQLCSWQCVSHGMCKMSFEIKKYLPSVSEVDMYIKREAYIKSLDSKKTKKEVIIKRSFFVNKKRNK